MNEKVKVHEHGFVKLLDIMGSDEEVENAARISYGEGTRKSSETRSLIRYLMRHRHTSPFEMGSVSFHIKLPIFIMRQLVRHRTANLNEASLRYSEAIDEYYVPDTFQNQSISNKQGRTDVEVENRGEVKFVIENIFKNTINIYHNLLDWGLARELARTILPVSNYTEVVWKIDLHNFFHFYKLRSSPHAQQEIRDYANIMYELVKPHFPICCEAFEDYNLNAETFSAEEMKIIRDMIKHSLDFNDSKIVEDLHIMTNTEFNLSTRERKEFIEKLI
ncbi:MAG: FAD-dependent thymidylate synthase [Candidatus Marinimicrobia bacterium]|nr:FAD-dependent thymidylate synthase [Candidatus Woesearchaeota archaeon]MBT5995865.1 FAD-dependent thymidylate synthase [Candidatus Neomarinimicrobiota bacterium]